jgi:hypothetical protein
MKYQLVLQFDARSLDDFDKFVALEEAFDEALRGVAKVDGHDFGSDEFNIFALTDKPREAFTTVQGLASRHGILNAMRAAFREVTVDDFVILWPPGLTRFTVA